MDRPGRPILVVGMHRSGTSLTMRMLEALGVDLGDPATHYPPDAVDNAEGYQEHVPVVELDDRLLGMLGGHASEPPRLPAGWAGRAEFAPLVREAKALLAQTFDGPTWAAKDPRASLLIPFWRRVEPNLRTIVCVRNPLEVAESMDRRGGPYSIEHWLSSWVAHTSAALADSDPADRMIVVYEDLVRSPGTVTDELSIFVDGSPPDLDLRARVAASIDAGRRRSSAGDRDLESDPHVPRDVARYYFSVRELARAQARSRIAASVR